MEARFYPETWNGGFYELAMEFKTSGSDLEKAFQAVSAHRDLWGWYRQPGIDPAQQPQVALTWSTLELNGHLYGMGILPNGRTAACGVCAVREDSGCTWLVLYLPTGLLGQAWGVGAYPFGDKARSRVWREPLENWLAQIGQAVYASSPFRLGLVGFEVSGM